MYKPPQNCNRVKSIKSKFENIENQTSTSHPKKLPGKRTEPLSESRLNNVDSPRKGEHQTLSRQTSDPLKRNVKRTHAFRVDKTSAVDKPCQHTLFETKVKQFNSVKSCEKKHDESASCDISLNTENARQKTDSHRRPSLIKSKSSHDFQRLRSKFNQVPSDSAKKHQESPTAPVSEDVLLLNNVDLSLLYTEPIPKYLRNKNSLSESSSSGPTESPHFKPKIDTIYTKSTLQLTDSDKKHFLDSLKKALSQDLPQGLTDSLKVALKKPLPNGPAPKKPPRTFQHAPQDIDVKTKVKRSDHKYMLNKLETALRNNKLRARKQVVVKKAGEVSTTTSGEDSDDSLLFRSKSCRSLPKPTTNNNSEFHLGDFNCFSSFGCRNPAYERVQEPNSSFFVDSEKDPIYAEPVQSCSGANGKNVNRNSLYYMSTALIPEDTGRNSGGMDGSGPLLDNIKGDADASLHRQLSAENSSLSSFTSDLDSNPSPVTDDPHAKIRFLIENFESRRQTLPKPGRRGRPCTTPPDGGGAGAGSNARIEVLRNSLKKTLDRSFASESALASSPKDNSDSDKNEEGKVARMVARFHTFQKTAPKYQQPKVNADTLFYCCLVIEKVCDIVRIKFKFPPDAEVPHNIEHLCFPENPDSPPLEGSSAAQTYTLLVTGETGDRTYGYCRRVLPEGSSHCLPLAYCILSKYRAPRFYKKILLELESRHGMQNKFRDELISQFYHKKFPKPGESIKINLSRIEGLRPSSQPNGGLEESLDLTSYTQVVKTGECCGHSVSNRTVIFVSESDFVDNCLTPTYVAYEGDKTELVLTLHPDTRYEDADLKRLHKLPTDILLKIFSSLLLERKVILISSVMSELSSCVDSLQSVLYPFTWYHTFIPILPESLWDIVESPTPVVCGVLSEDAIEDKRIENAIVVNLDTRSVLIEEGDEMKILSGSLHKVWRQFITLANNTRSMEYVYSVYLADAYLYVFICCFKNYKKYIADGRFLKDDLVKNAKSKGVRRFLKMFTETCMFHAFMDAALHNPDSLAAFDKKIELYGSDESRTILDKLIEWHR